MSPENWKQGDSRECWVPGQKGESAIKIYVHFTVFCNFSSVLGTLSIGSALGVCGQVKSARFLPVLSRALCPQIPWWTRWWQTPWGCPREPSWTGPSSWGTCSTPPPTPSTARRWQRICWNQVPGQGLGWAGAHLWAGLDCHKASVEVTVLSFQLAQESSFFLLSFFLGGGNPHTFAFVTGLKNIMVYKWGIAYGT